LTHSRPASLGSFPYPVETSNAPYLFTIIHNIFAIVKFSPLVHTVKTSKKL